MTDFHVSIIGAGSVGLCLAGHFAAAGAQVSLLVRLSSVEKMRGRPLTVGGVLGEYSFPTGRIAILDATSPPPEVLNSDMLVVTTKAYDVETVLRPFAGAPLCPAVLLMQNGLGSEEIARRILGGHVPIYSSAMMIGMVRSAPTDVEVTGQAGPILCGPLSGGNTAPLEAMLSVSQNGFLPAQLDPDIRDTIFFKLLFNSCMNPTGALTGQTYGGLLENTASRALIAGLAEETLQAFAKGYGYRPAVSGQDYVDGALTGIVFPRAQNHRSSMLEDIKAGRQTEIEFLNGAIIRLAGNVGLDAPRHETVRHLIRARESQGAQGGL